MLNLKDQRRIPFTRMGEKRRNKVGKKIFIFLLILSLSAGITSTAYAQGQTGSMKGKITDGSGHGIKSRGRISYDGKDSGDVSVGWP